MNENLLIYFISMQFSAITRSTYSAISIESWNTRIEECLDEQEILSAIYELNRLLAKVIWWNSFHWDEAKEKIINIL